MPERSSPAGSTTTLGVEEEFLLVEADSYAPAPRIFEVLDDARKLAGSDVEPELHSAQIEIATPPCTSLSEVRRHLTRLRGATATAAAGHAARVVASATYPGKMGWGGRLITPKPRYQEMPKLSGSLAGEHLISGCHIHVAMDDPEAAIRVLNRARRWTACLLAISANSPFWEGEDSGFSSFRTVIWARWPMAGPTQEFAGPADYDRLLDSLVSSGVILDEAMAYWDVRPSRKFPTLEFRVADVMPSVDDVVLVAALTRALARQCQDAEDVPLRVELLRASSWRAALNGISGTLLDPAEGRSYPAREMIDRLVSFVRPALEDSGDFEEVSGLLEQLFRRGTGADRQREVYGRDQSVSDVIAWAALEPDG